MRKCVKWESERKCKKIVCGVQQRSCLSQYKLVKFPNTLFLSKPAMCYCTFTSKPVVVFLSFISFLSFLLRKEKTNNNKCEKAHAPRSSRKNNLQSVAHEASCYLPSIRVHANFHPCRYFYNFLCSSGIKV
jgi:hypothetical protein